jgi:putative oxidoreductase
MERVKQIQRAIGPWVGSVVLLLMRLFWGYHFITHGVQKLSNIDQTASFFGNLNIMWPTATAWFVGLSEALGGLGLLLGAFSPIATLLLTGVMAGAYYTAHSEGLYALFSNPQLFINQPPFMYMLTALLVFSFGPGKFSVDQYLSRGEE